MVSVIIKTPRGIENIVATRVKEIFPDISLVIKPSNYAGILFINGGDPVSIADIIAKRVPEVEKTLPILAETEADPKSIADAAVKIAKKYIKEGESFAVRTKRRGNHNFTSIDINTVVGARIREELGNPVDLDNPEKVVWVEIFNKKAYLSITKELVIKKLKGDFGHKILRKISIIQMPYLGDVEGAYRMGVRIGRAAQTFEIGELIIALDDITNVVELTRFLEGVLEGRKSRYEIQKKSYRRQVNLVPVKIYELYQLVRNRHDEVLISTSTRGRELDDKICEEIIEMFSREKRINILIGSREGLPSGVLRWSKYTLNLCPGITFATEHGIPIVVSAIINCLQIKKEIKV